MTSLLVATNNLGKQEEFRRLLAGVPGNVVVPADIGLDLSPDEPHDTYAANAAAKADAFCRASGLLTLADDAGIEVAALGWGPGVRTARYAAGSGRDGADLLLERIAGDSDRRARMVCALALAVPAALPAGEPAIEIFEGVMDGEVAVERRGTGGFGFDPIFLLPDGVTTAELPAAQKDARSHRGRALAAAMPRILELLTTARGSSGQ